MLCRLIASLISGDSFDSQAAILDLTGDGWREPSDGAACSVAERLLVPWRAVADMFSFGTTGLAAEVFSVGSGLQDCWRSASTRRSRLSERQRSGGARVLMNGS